MTWYHTMLSLLAMIPVSFSALMFLQSTTFLVLTCRRDFENPVRVASRWTEELMVINLATSLAIAYLIVFQTSLLG